MVLPPAMFTRVDTSMLVAELAAAELAGSLVVT